MEAGRTSTQAYCRGEKTYTPTTDKPNFILKSKLVITTKLLNEAHRSPSLLTHTPPTPTLSHPLFWPS